MCQVGSRYLTGAASGTGPTLQVGKQAQRGLVAGPEPYSHDSQLGSWLTMGQAEGCLPGFFPSARTQAYHRCLINAKHTGLSLGFPSPHHPSGGRLPAHMLPADIHRVPTVCTALGWGLGDVDPKQEQESRSVQAGNANVLQRLGASPVAQPPSLHWCPPAQTPHHGLTALR